MEGNQRLKAAVVADTDSRWKWALATATRLGISATTLVLVPSPAEPSDRQLREAGADPARLVRSSIAGLPSTLTGVDVVIVALPGDACQAVWHRLAAAELGPGRPVLVTGYVGVVYERVAEGLLLRAGADLILANSPADADTFRGIFRDQGLGESMIAQAGMPFLKVLERRPGPFTLTFATQPDVPRSRAERSYLMDRLVRYADTHPHRRVIVKLRGTAGERATHAEPYPYQRLLHAGAPANLEFRAGPMTDVLAETDLLVTVSSTAASEAIHAGIPTAILTDFGITEATGVPYFSGSGAFASFDDLDTDRLPAVRADWWDAHGSGGTHDAATARIAELLAAPRPPITPFYSRDRAPYLVPHLLARHGLGPDGTPLPGPVGPRRVRQALGSVARTLYRQGTTVIAPALRRWGSG